RAGLVPALRDDPVAERRPSVVRILTPGERPATAFGHLLAPVKMNDGTGDTVVVVDQFEEAFALCQDAAERSAFFGALLAARSAGSRLRVVVAVRADFFGRCAEHRGLAEALREASVLVGPMGREELREAVVKPAQSAGLIVERALTARIVDEVADEPGGLPLMSHALLETWRRRSGKALTVAGYEAAGGLHGAIAQTAEELYARLAPAQAVVLRRLLLRLVTPGSGAPDTRRPAERAELLPSGHGEAEAESVLEALVRARLVILDGTRADLAHEAVLTAWPRLREWIEEDRERLRVHRRMTEAAGTWQELGRDAGALYRGTQLALLREWLARPSAREELNSQERAFADASIAAQDAEQNRALRTARRLRVLAAALAGLLVAVTAIGTVAVQQRGQAEEQRAEAVRAQRIALSRQLAAQALGMADTRQHTAMLLSVEAYRAAPTQEARSAVLSMDAHKDYRTRISGHSGPAYDMVFGLDGLLATVGRDGKLALWDTEDKKREAVLEGGSRLHTVDISPDGRRAATGGSDGKAVLWDLAARERTGSLPSDVGPVRGVAFSPDGHSLAVAGTDGRIEIHDVRGKSRPQKLTGHSGTVQTVAFSPDGRTLASAGADDTVWLWKTETGKREAALTGHDGSVGPLAFAPDGRTLASGGTDSTVRLWNVRKHRSRATLTGHEGRINALAFAPDGRTLATVGADDSVMLWDARRHYRQAVLTGHTDDLYALAFQRDGRQLAAAGADGSISLWDPSRIPLAGHTDGMTDIDFSPDGRTLATSGRDGATVLWNPADRTRRAALDSGAAQGAFAAFSPDGTTLATGGDTEQPGKDGLALWDTTSRRPSRTERIGHGGSSDIAFSPDGRILAVARAQDNTIELRDAQRPERATTLPAPNTSEGVSGIAFSPDSRTLAVARRSGTTLWDTTERVRRATLSSPAKASLTTAAIAFSPDGRVLAVASAQNTVTLWDVAERKTVATLNGHGGPVYDLAFSPDGKTLATANADTTAVLWDVEKRVPRASLTGHTGPIRAIAFSPDGKTLATGSDDRTALLWTTDPRRKVRELCATTRGGLSKGDWARYLPETPYRKTCPR
ncbi:WD40 repeat domain-containing protein, partial [Streptomyces daliensis]|nr:WD40 repeat domain-containing protein [Streptomyces daliensis]